MAGRNGLSNWYGSDEAPTLGVVPAVLRTCDLPLTIPDV
jgi:hypothetical protein